jgi:NAD(P)-dependent dehydrogenase (short-subunit alcohol dehydrogenase family)
MSGRLQDKVCLITGAAQGIGAAYARACAAEGAAVAIVDYKRIDQAADVEKDIAALGGRSISIKADVSDEAQMARSPSGSVTSSDASTVSSTMPA